MIRLIVLHCLACFASPLCFAVIQPLESAADLAQLKQMAAGEVGEPTPGQWYGTPRWKALIRLAQLGDRGAAERVVAVARRQAANASAGKARGVLENIVILDNVASIRQPEAVEFLKEYLDSDERLPDLDGGVPGTPISHRAAALLASLVEEFPVKKEYCSDYTTEDIQACRKWMASHMGSVET